MSRTLAPTEAQLTEWPISFSGAMVRAILAGEKTQTRRVVSAKTIEFFGGPAASISFAKDGHSGPGWYIHSPEYPDEGAGVLRCPQGSAGDVLWVRETHKVIDREDVYLAGGLHSLDHQVEFRADVTGKDYGGWTPSIFMPRWASRIQLEVTGVRVERLNAITRDDAIAEGVSQFYEWALDPIRKYRELWDSLNAKRGFGWDTNPHVWVVSFRRIKP